MQIRHWEHPRRCRSNNLEGTEEDHVHECQYNGTDDGGNPTLDRKALQEAGRDLQHDGIHDEGEKTKGNNIHRQCEEEEYRSKGHVEKTNDGADHESTLEVRYRKVIDNL